MELNEAFHVVLIGILFLETVITIGHFIVPFILVFSELARGTITLISARVPANYLIFSSSSPRLPLICLREVRPLISVDLSYFENPSYYSDNILNITV